MSEIELGEATIVYEDPDEGLTETRLDNEHVVYVRDHWMVKAGTDDEGNDLMRQIPRDRVHYVERNVERFESEASTVRDRLESVAEDLREKIPVSSEREASSDRGEEEPIEVETPNDSHSD
jgi:hypothetical protein